MSSTEASRTIRPLLTMWIRPRETTRYLIDRGPRADTYLLGTCIGVSWVLSIGSVHAPTIGLTAWQTLGYSLLLGAPIGYLSFIVASVFYSFSGRPFGGIGKPRDLRIAIAWSFLPGLASLAFQVLDLALLGGRFYGTNQPTETTYLTLALRFTVPLILALLGLYSIVLWAVAYSEAHSISVLRGIASLVVGGLLVGMAAGMAVFILPLLLVIGLIIYGILTSLVAA